MKTASPSSVTFFISNFLRRTLNYLLISEINLPSFFECNSIDEYLSLINEQMLSMN